MNLLKQLILFSIAGLILTINLWYGAPITPPPDFNESFPPKLFQELHTFIWLFFSASLVLMLCKKINLTVFLTIVIGLVIVPLGGVLELIRTGEAENLLPFEHSLPTRVADVIYYFINDIRLKLIGYSLIAILCHHIISMLTKHNPQKTILIYTAFFLVVLMSIWCWQFRGWGVTLYHACIFLFAVCLATMNLWLDKNKHTDKEF